MPKLNTKKEEEVVIEPIVEEVIMPKTKHPNPIIQMAIEQAEERLIKSMAK
jgi:hypothetical protein